VGKKLSRLVLTFLVGSPHVAGELGLSLERQLVLEIAVASDRKQIGLVGAVGIEPTNYMEIKESCGTARPSKVLKGIQRNR